MLVTNGLFSKGSYLAVIEGLDEKYVLSRKFVEIFRKCSTQDKETWEMILTKKTSLPIGTILALKLVSKKLGFEKENQKEKYYKVVKDLATVKVLTEALEEMNLEEVKKAFKQ